MSDNKKQTKQDEGEEIVTDEHETEIKKLQELVEESENKYKRALADYQNLEKRVAEQRGEWIRTANKDLLLRLLPVFDTLILASEHLDKNGIEAVIRMFEDVLKQEGVTRIQTKGQSFDPLTMECIQTIKGEHGKIIQETRAGFLIGDKILRPAQVIVGGEN